LFGDLRVIQAHRQECLCHKRFALRVADGLG
jgi:hypothetical protein